MSAESLLKNEAQATTAEDQGLLSKVVAATRQTEPDRAQNLLRTLTDQALKGTVKYDRNLTVTLNHAIAELDRTISEQLAAIMQAPEFAFDPIRGELRARDPGLMAAQDLLGRVVDPRSADKPLSFGG